MCSLREKERDWGVLVLPILKIRISATRYRVADICVIRRSAPSEEIVTVAPLLCVEVLSPDDRMSDMLEKVDDYLGMGVGIVWMVGPWRRKAFFADAKGRMQRERN